MAFLNLISTFILTFILVCIWHQIINKKVPFKSLKLWSITILITLIGFFLSLVCPKPFKMILSFLILTISAYFILRIDFKTSLFIVVISQIEVMVIELIFFTIISLTFNKITSYEDIISIISNIFVSLILFITLKFRLLEKMLKKIKPIISLMKNKEVIKYCLMIITVIVISTVQGYLDINKNIVLINNTSMALIFIFIVFKSALEKEKYNQISNKYAASIDSLKEYETVLDNYHFLSHENNNQLETIKGMTKNKTIINFINAILQEKNDYKEKIRKKMSKIPNGGLKAIIYPKIKKMEDLGIKYKLLVSREIKASILINMEEVLMKDICTILGIYLDNAIEAVKDLKTKEIFIELYKIEEDIFIDITNNFEGTIDVEKMNKTHYTTKGKGHGYGLALVNIIDKSNSKIKTETEVKGNKITKRILFNLN